VIAVATTPINTSTITVAVIHGDILSLWPRLTIGAKVSATISAAVTGRRIGRAR
jgi:hypothetical protein